MADSSTRGLRGVIDPDDVVDIHDICDRLGITMPECEAWSCEPTFPDPLARLTIGQIWYWPEIVDWLLSEKGVDNVYTRPHDTNGMVGAD